MAPPLRRLVLTAHILSSVGWFGAVAGFLALAVVGLTGAEERTVRGAYLALAVLARYVILPLCLASFATGVVGALGTAWGLFRHYWVLLKLAIVALSTAILLLHLGPIDYLAGVAATTVLAAGDELPVRIQLIVASGAALVALFAATILSVYKPRGLTPYGWRTQRRRGAAGPGLH